MRDSPVGGDVRSAPYPSCSTSHPIALGWISSVFLLLFFWLYYYLHAFGFSFLPSSPASFLYFRYSFLRLFPSDALFLSFILLSTFLSFFLPTQPFPILPRFLSRAVKRIKLHLFEPRNQTQRLKTTTHCVSEQGNQTENLRDHNYGWRSGALCIKFSRLVLLFIEEWLFSISSLTKVWSYLFSYTQHVFCMTTATHYGNYLNSA